MNATSNQRLSGSNFDAWTPQGDGVVPNNAAEASRQWLARRLLQSAAIAALAIGFAALPVTLGGHGMLIQALAEDSEGGEGNDGGGEDGGGEDGGGEDGGGGEDSGGEDGGGEDGGGEDGGGEDSGGEDGGEGSDGGEDGGDDNHGGGDDEAGEDSEGGEDGEDGEDSDSEGGSVIIPAPGSSPW